MGSHALRRSKGDASDVREVLDALRVIVRELRVASRDAEKKHGLGSARLFVLQQLADAPARSLNELAARTHTDQSSVSVVVAHLVDAGLVERRRAADDARRIELSLTAKGRALAKKAPRAPQHALVEAIHALPATRRKALARDLAALVAHMGADETRPSLFFEDGRPSRSPRRPS